MKENKGVMHDIDLDTEDMKTLVGDFKDDYKTEIGDDFPPDPKQ